MASLQDKIDAYGNPAHMMQNAQTGRYQFPIPAEFTNWVDEQRAWREAAVIFDQSVHMTDLYVQGPDTLRLLSDLAVNSIAGFGRNKAKQIVCVNPDGYLIGDCILFGLEDDAVNIVGRPPLPNWVQFHAETGGYDVEIVRDERKLDNPDAPRLTYRLEVQGPAAMDILEEVNETGPLVTKFFSMGEIAIAGCAARTLAHGMGGEKGLELWGPLGDKDRVLEALLKAGEKHGIKRAGARAYSTASTESGWIASPLPAVYSGEAMRAYRQWLPANSFEAVSSIGGSYVSDNVEDYYLTPWDLDYQRVVKFDHDFIGRDALVTMADEPHRTKVTLVWDRDSIVEIFGGLFDPGLAPKLMEMPAGHYAAHPYDRVERDGRLVGFSTYPVYSANEKAWLSLATVDADATAPGTRFDVIWGEPGGGSAKPMVERHRQIVVRTTAQPWPIHEASRREYRGRA